jgi:hypothetical protein
MQGRAYLALVHYTDSEDNRICNFQTLHSGVRAVKAYFDEE